MSHFAKVDQGKVIQVIVAEQDFIDSFVDTVPGEWIQTSYNTHGGVHYTDGVASDDQTKALRYNYATVGGNYDRDADAFYDNQPFPSWTLNTETYIWEAPTPQPADGASDWNEDTQTWDALESE